MNREPMQFPARPGAEEIFVFDSGAPEARKAARLPNARCNFSKDAAQTSSRLENAHNPEGKENLPC